jgi:pyruvate dehydrogenase E1 component beta subunit
MESELLYGTTGEVPEGEYTIPFGKADTKRQGRDVTLITWGKQVFTTLKAAELLAQDGIEAEVIDLRSIRPLDIEAIVESVRRTNRVVVVQEGWPVCGVASEVCYRIQEEVFDYLDAPVKRITNLDVPMPYAHNLEEAILPSPERVASAAREVCYRR